MMKAVDREVAVCGMNLHRREWVPAGQSRAAVAIVHGQGDAVDRYEFSVVRMFASHGVACTGIDFPGHGRSPGRRGDIPDLTVVRAVMRAAFDAAAALAPGGPVGVFAHSMGGLLAVDWLASPGAPRPDFFWLSSPLVDPRHRQPWWMLVASHVVGSVMPSLIFPSGVRPGDCRRVDPEVGPNPCAGMLHDRIRVGWGLELFRIADRVSRSVAGLPARLPLLFSQGLADPVCPAELGRGLFDALPCGPKRWLPLAGGLHEPFDDLCREELLIAAAEWLENVLAA